MTLGKIYNVISFHKYHIVILPLIKTIWCRFIPVNASVTHTSQWNVKSQHVWQWKYKNVLQCLIVLYIIQKNKHYPYLDEF